MQIPQELPQFKRERALLIVSGRLGMDFYLASEGEMNQLDSFRFSNPAKNYTDNEGYFESRSGGSVVSGSVREPKKQRQRQELYRELKKHLKRILKKEKINKLYLFAPQDLHKEVEQVIRDSLSNKLKNEIEQVVPGNFMKMSATDLLERLDQERKAFAG